MVSAGRAVHTQRCDHLFGDGGIGAHWISPAASLRRLCRSARISLRAWKATKSGTPSFLAAASVKVTVFRRRLIFVLIFMDANWGLQGRLHLRISVPDAHAFVPVSGPGLNAAVCHTTGLMPASSTGVPRCYKYS